MSSASPSLNQSLINSLITELGLLRGILLYRRERSDVEIDFYFLNLFT